MNLQEMQQELENRLSISSSNTFWTSSQLVSWLNQAMIYCCGYKKWPFTEDIDISLTTIASKEDYNYPLKFKSDSIRILTIDGKMYEKIRYDDYLRYKEDDPTGTDRVFSDYKRVIYINPDAFSAGKTITIYGQVTPISLTSGKTGVATATTANKLVDATKSQFVVGDVGKTVWNKIDNTFAIVTACDSATTLSLDTDIMASAEDYVLYSGANKSPFSDAEETGNYAIIQRALAIALKKGKKVQEALVEETGAETILDGIWKRIQEEQDRYKTKNRSLFKRIDIIKGTTRGETPGNF